MQIRTITQTLVFAGMALWVASCGQKGPLYLPDQNFADHRLVAVSLTR